MKDAFKKGFGWITGMFVGCATIHTLTTFFKEVLTKDDADSTEDSKKDEEEA